MLHKPYLSMHKAYGVDKKISDFNMHALHPELSLSDLFSTICSVYVDCAVTAKPSDTWVHTFIHSFIPAISIAPLHSGVQRGCGRYDGPGHPPWGIQGAKM